MEPHDSASSESPPNTNAQAFEQWTSGIYHIAACIAFVAAGAWAVYSFRVLLQNEERAQEPVIVVEVQGSPVGSKDGARRYLSGSVTVENVGSRRTVLFFSGDPVILSKVTFERDGRPVFREVLRYRPRREDNAEEGLSRIGLRSNDRAVLPFFFPVETPGIYFVSFGVSTGADTDLREEDRPYWGASAFVMIE